MRKWSTEGIRYLSMVTQQRTERLNSEPRWPDGQKEHNFGNKKANNLFITFFYPLYTWTSQDSTRDPGYMIIKLMLLSYPVQRFGEKGRIIINLLNRYYVKQWVEIFIFKGLSIIILYSKWLYVIGSIISLFSPRREDCIIKKLNNLSLSPSQDFLLLEPCS